MTTRKLAIALLHNHFDADHLEQVKAEMATMGAPTIRVAWHAGGVWVALEGCHRLRAAKALGLTPVIIPVEYDDETTTEDAGFTDDELPDVLVIADVVDKASNRLILDFEPQDDD
ncbi:MAG: ParB N-terminal domain-containing protein [Candidatus Pacebacteria bacterium]|nr:ParB N-terminal domain-containing protein [Candidatus Paceibacterota bacterium]